MVEVIIKDAKKGAFKNVSLRDPELVWSCTRFSTPLPPNGALLSAVNLTVM